MITITLPIVGYLKYGTGNHTHWKNYWDDLTKEDCLRILGYVPDRDRNFVTFRDESDVTLFFLCIHKEDRYGLSGYSGASFKGIVVEEAAAFYCPYIPLSSLKTNV